MRRRKKSKSPFFLSSSHLVQIPNVVALFGILFPLRRQLQMALSTGCEWKEEKKMKERRKEKKENEREKERKERK